MRACSQMSTHKPASIPLAINNEEGSKDGSTMHPHAARQGKTMAYSVDVTLTRLEATSCKMGIN